MPPRENEDPTPEQAAKRAAYLAKKRAHIVKRKAKNRVKRNILLKAEYGNDTDKTEFDTTKTSATCMSEDISDGGTKLSYKIDPCPPGKYVVEWYVDVEDDGAGRPMGRLRLNRDKKHNARAKKNGGPNYYYNGIEEITILERFQPQLFEIDVEKVSGGKAKIQEGSIYVCRRKPYTPPQREPNPEDPVLPPFPIDNQGAS